MRKINAQEIIDGIKDMIAFNSKNLAPDVLKKLNETYKIEQSPVSREVLRQILENSDIAKNESRPLCQDTGLAVFFVKIGDDVKIEGGNLKKIINQATKEAYEENLLRASTCIWDTRENLKNTLGYNLPAIIHFDLVEGDELEIEYAAKGGGSENVSRAKVLPPAAGKQGIIEFVEEVVSNAGPNACPPFTVGVGIGGSFEKAAILSKKALFRSLDDTNDDPKLADMEDQLKEILNGLGIGAMGMGGTQSVIGVNIIAHPCHIASLPVSVNIQCHSARHAKIKF